MCSKEANKYGQPIQFTRKQLIKLKICNTVTKSHWTDKTSSTQITAALANSHTPRQHGIVQRWNEYRTDLICIGHNEQTSNTNLNIDLKACNLLNQISLCHMHDNEQTNKKCRNIS